MFAILGDIQFDLITYFDGFDSSFSANFAEHPLIDGKPRLQSVGDNLDEIRMQLVFHQQYCDPETELAKLIKAKAAHHAMPFVLGNGDYKGWFVMTDVQASTRHTDKAGTLVALDANVTLREYVGDKLNPLKPPAIHKGVLPAASRNQPFGAMTPTANALHNSIRQVVSYTSQAKSALQAASYATSLARRMKQNPAAAMTRLPSMMSCLSQASAPLALLIPSATVVTDQMPEMMPILQAASAASRQVNNASSSMQGASPVTISERLDQSANYLDVASRSLDSASPTVSRLAANVTTRSI